MMDSSASVGSKNFEMTKEFTQMLAKRFLSAERGGFQVQVGIGQYSDNVNLEAAFSSNTTQAVAQIAEAKFQNAGTQVQALSACHWKLSGVPGQRKKKEAAGVFGWSFPRRQQHPDWKSRELSEQRGHWAVRTGCGQPGKRGPLLRTLVSRGRPIWQYTYAYRHLSKYPTTAHWSLGSFTKLYPARFPWSRGGDWGVIGDSGRGSGIKGMGGSMAQALIVLVFCMFFHVNDISESGFS